MSDVSNDPTPVGPVDDPDIIEKKPSVPDVSPTPGWIKINKKGELRAPFRTFLRLMFSDDNLMPSSTRVIGTTIFTFLVAAMTAFTWVVTGKIHATTDPAIINALVGGFRYIFWFFMFMAASALSMYGIHVWKYLGQLQSGLGVTGGTGSPWNPSSFATNTSTVSQSSSISTITPVIPMLPQIPRGLPSDISGLVSRGSDPTPVPPPKPLTKTSIAGFGSDD
jgi:hypothetical protein